MTNNNNNSHGGIVWSRRVEAGQLLQAGVFLLALLGSVATATIYMSDKLSNLHGELYKSAETQNERFNNVQIQTAQQFTNYDQRLSAAEATLALSSGSTRDQLREIDDNINELRKEIAVLQTGLVGKQDRK